MSETDDLRRHAHQAIYGPKVGECGAASLEPSEAAIEAAVGWLKAITPRNMSPEGYRNWARRVLEAAYAVDALRGSLPADAPPSVNRSDPYYSLAAKWELDAAALELNHGFTKAMIGATALRACAKELLGVAVASRPEGEKP